MPMKNWNVTRAATPATAPGSTHTKRLALLIIGLLAPMALSILLISYGGLTGPPLLLVILAAFCWLSLSEFSYLGTSCIRRVYDTTAKAYERKWDTPSYTSQDNARRLFLDPVLSAAVQQHDKKVADLACGTGRLTMMLLEHGAYDGSVEAVDLSAGMLQQLRDKLTSLPAEVSRRVAVSELDVRDWRPQAETFAAVGLLEASEFIPNLPRVLENAHRSLRPGGLLLMTKVRAPWCWLLPGRHQATQSQRRLLEDLGFEAVQFHSWRRRYDVVHARKPSLLFEPERSVHRSQCDGRRYR